MGDCFDMGEKSYVMDTHVVLEMPAVTRRGVGMSGYQVQQDLINRLEREGRPYVILEPKVGV